MYYGHSDTTPKQIGFAAKLARDVGAGSDAVDLLQWHYGWSRSKATGKMSKETLSVAIDAALKAKA